MSEIEERFNNFLAEKEFWNDYIKQLKSRMCKFDPEFYSFYGITSNMILQKAKEEGFITSFERELIKYYVQKGVSKGGKLC